MNVKDIKNLKSINAFNGEFAIFTEVSSRQGLINRQGEILLPAGEAEDKRITHICDDLFKVEHFNQLDEYTIEMELDFVFDAKKQERLEQKIVCKLQSGDYVVQSENKNSNNEYCYGLIDANFNKVIPAEYNGIMVWKDKVIVTKNGKKQIIDRKGESVSPLIFDSCVLKNWDAPEMSIAIDGEWFLINDKGQRLTNGKYEYIEPFNSAGYTIVQLNGRICIIDKQENLVLSTDFTELQNNIFYNKFLTGDKFAFVENDRCGIMDIRGNVLLPAEYKHIKLYESDVKRVVVVDQFGRQGVIDTDCNIVIPCQYKLIIYRPQLEVFKVRNQENKFGLLDENGNEILPTEYDHINIGNTYGLDEIAVTKDGECYFVNSQNKRVKVF